MTAVLIVTGAVVAAVVLADLVASLRMVKQLERGVVFRFGRVQPEPARLDRSGSWR